MRMRTLTVLLTAVLACTTYIIYSPDGQPKMCQLCCTSSGQCYSYCV